MYAWLFLVAAILCEVTATSAMKFSDGMTKPLPASASMLFYTLSGVAAAIAMKQLDLSTVYAIWVGLGLVLTTLIAILVFGEALTPLKALWIGLIVIGTTGLYLGQSASA